MAGRRPTHRALVSARAIVHQVGSCSPSAHCGFVPIAKRWGVERTFAWFTGFRRLAIDYDFAPRSHKT